MANLYKIFIVIGAIFMLTGIGLFILQKLHIPLGRLPGDIVITKEKFSFYFPVTTCIVVSVLLTIIFYLFGKLK